MVSQWSKVLFAMTIVINLTCQNLASRQNFEYPGSVAAQSSCSFPVEWRGSWFHGGFPQPLNITQNVISNKGTCLQNIGSRYIVAER